MKILMVFFFFFNPEYIKTHAKKLMIISDQGQLFHFFFLSNNCPNLRDWQQNEITMKNQLAQLTSVFFYIPPLKLRCTKEVGVYVGTSLIHGH